MEMKFNNRDPVYVQVVRHFKQQIAVGLLLPGQTIPSRRELANTLKINPNTAQRAYKEMEEAGLIKTESNQLSTITSDNETIESVRNELIQEAVSSFVDSIRSIGVSLDEALTYVEKTYTSRHKGGDPYDRS